MKRCHLHRAAVAATVALLVTANSAGLAFAQPAKGSDVVTFGRDQNRTHYSSDLAGWSMCLVWDLPVGPSRSQPLIVRRDFGGGERVYLHHTASQYLVTVDLGKSGDRPETKTWRPPAGLEKTAYLHPFRDNVDYRSIVTAYTWLAPPVERAVEEGDPEWQRLFNPSAFSFSHPVYWRSPTDPKDDYIVTASAYGTVVGVRAHDHAYLGSVSIPYGATDLDFGVVASPLVVNDDTVLVPATNGYIYTITGFRSKNPVRDEGTWVGARLSSSPVMVGDKLILGTDPGGVKGLTMIRDGEGRLGLWPEWTYDTPDGVAAGVATDGNLIYVTEKTGIVMALTASGALVWKRQVGGWTNLEPAIGQNTVYVALRWDTGYGHTVGSILALARHDGVYAGRQRRAGDLLWRQTLGAPANVAPAVLARNEDGEELVYTADIAGVVQAWNGSDGTPALFTQGHMLDTDSPLTCSDWNDEVTIKAAAFPVDRVNLAKGVGVYKGSLVWDAINGAGTQPSLAHRFLAVGLNIKNPGDGKPAGFLRVYRLFPPLTMELENLHAAGLPEVQPKQEVRVTGRVRIKSEPGFELPGRVGILVFWENEPASMYTVPIDVTGNAPEAVAPFSFTQTAPDKGAARLWVVLNPYQLMPALVRPNPYLDLDVQFMPYRQRLKEKAPQYDAELAKRRADLAGGIAPLEKAATPAGHVETLEFRVVNKQDIQIGCPVAVPATVPYEGFSVTFSVDVPGKATVPASLRLDIGGTVHETATANLPPGTSHHALAAGHVFPGTTSGSVKVFADDPDLDPDLANNVCTFSTEAMVPRPPAPPGQSQDRSILVR